MSQLFDRIRRLFRSQPMVSEGPCPPPATPVPLLDEASIATLMQLVEKTNAGEYSCAETFDLLDEYVELATSGKDVEMLMPLVKKHLEHCPDCGLRFQILLDIVENP